MKLYNLINFLINNPCEDPEILRIILFIRKILEIAFIVIPIVLIVLITFDFIKNVTANSEDTMKKTQKIVVKRIIYALMLFFVMPIVNLSFSAFGTSGNDELISEEVDGEKVSYLSCWDNAKNEDTVNSFEIIAMFDANGGRTFGGETKKCGGSQKCQITLPSVSRNGYTFYGWTTEMPTATMKKYKVGQKVSITKNNNKFYACWDEKCTKGYVDNNKQDSSNSNTLNKDVFYNQKVKVGNYTFPLYNTQHDEKYLNIKYGTSSMYKAGCGVFSGAMLLAGLTNDYSITPDSYLEEINNYFPNYTSYFDPDIGSIYPGIYTDEFLRKVYNVESIWVSNQSDALRHLENGYPAIAAIEGHILAVIPAPESDKKNGAKFYVLDSIKKSTGAYKSTSDFVEVNRKKNGNRKGGWDINFRFLLKPAG